MPWGRLLNMTTKYKLAAIKGSWLFQVWVETEAMKVPIYSIVSIKEGPAAWIPVGEDKVSRN
jgi:hypothetical protein